MKPNDERDQPLSSEDARLIRAIDASLRPEPMDPARRSEFRAALEARIEQGAHPWRWLAPTGVALAAAAVTVWLVRPVAVEPEPLQVASAELYPLGDLAADELADGATYLPDDYRALALLIESEDAEP